VHRVVNACRTVPRGDVSFGDVRGRDSVPGGDWWIWWIDGWLFHTRAFAKRRAAGDGARWAYVSTVVVVL